MKPVTWYFSRWWAHTWALIRSPQFWVTLTLLVGLSAGLVYFTQRSGGEYYSRSYQYLRAGEYQKGWNEFKKALGRTPVFGMFRAESGAKSGNSSKPGGRSRNAAGLQAKIDQGPATPGNFLAGADQSHPFPWGTSIIVVLSVVAATAAIYIFTAVASYEFEFKWKIDDQEYTGKLECKDEEDLKHRLRIKGGELIEVFKKVKISWGAARKPDTRQIGEASKISLGAPDGKDGGVRCPSRDFAAESQPVNRKYAWVVHLIWFVMGLYVLFILFWFVWGGLLLLSAKNK